MYKYEYLKFFFFIQGSRYTILKMAAEYIFIQTDPTFNLALFITRELGDADRMVVQSQSSAEITNIESNVNGNEFHFGDGGNDVCAFSRTAGAVFRMCMLRATNVPKALWPQQNNPMKRRNENKIIYEQLFGNAFKLADQRPPARHYWSKYDQLYPHYVIEDKINVVGLGMQVALSSMMLIFRDNFQQVIEINTTANATRHIQPDNHFDSYVRVIVTVRSIPPGEDGNWLKVLRYIINDEYGPLHNGVGALNQGMAVLSLSGLDPDEGQGDED